MLCRFPHPSGPSSQSVPIPNHCSISHHPPVESSLPGLNELSQSSALSPGHGALSRSRQRSGPAYTAPAGNHSEAPPVRRAHAVGTSRRREGEENSFRRSGATLCHTYRAGS